MLRRLLLPVLLLAGLAAAQPALAAYPEKPIRLIVPSAPGGAPDALMRALGQQLSVQMGVPVVIDNKPGGSYVIGTMDLENMRASGTLGEYRPTVMWQISWQPPTPSAEAR